MNIKPFMKTAIVWAHESTCAKKQVGAVIFNKVTKHLVSIGYNGTIAGAEHCTDYFRITGQKCLINRTLSYVPGMNFDEYYGKCNVSSWCEVTEPEWNNLHHKFAELYEVHAEQNAVYNMLKLGTDLKDVRNLVLVSTLEPCSQCLKLIASIGIREVYYLDEYHGNTRDNWFDMKCMQVDIDANI